MHQRIRVLHICPISLSSSFIPPLILFSQEFLCSDSTFRQETLVFFCAFAIPPSILVISVPTASRDGALHQVKGLFMDVKRGNFLLTRGYNLTGPLFWDSTTYASADARALFLPSLFLKPFKDSSSGFLHVTAKLSCCLRGTVL